MHVFVGLMILNQFYKIVSPTGSFKRTYKNAAASCFFGVCLIVGVSCTRRYNCPRNRVGRQAFLDNVRIYFLNQ